MLIESAIAGGARQVNVACRDVLKSWSLFSDQFELVQAAGCLVVDTDQRLLFIFRQGKWDLPKGKVEEGEQLEAAALREIEEECSISGLEIVQPLCATWHTYIQAGEPILKSTSWFLMSYSGTEMPKPQIEEGITRVKWFRMDELAEPERNTYPSIVDVLQHYRLFLDR
jgi:ADP-ribose pyrophosphatase YjhB (NUDIX family)